MKHLYQKSIFAAIVAMLFLSFTQAYSFIDYTLLKHPTEKKFVLLYGDLHRQELEKFNKHHLSCFINTCFNKKNSLLQWSNDNKLPVDIFFECPDDITSLQARIVTSTLFSKYKQFKPKYNDYFQFYPYEKRETVCSAVSNLFSTLELWLYQFLNQDPYQKLLGTDPETYFITPQTTFQLLKRCCCEIQKTNSEVEKKHKLVTKQQYLEKMQSHISYLSSIKLPEKTKFLVKQLKNSFEQIKQDFDGLKDLGDNPLLNSCFLKLFECETIKTKCPYKACLALFKKYLDQTDYLLADIYFLEKILQSQNENEITIFVVGQKHTNQLTKTLKSIGYTVSKQKTFFEPTTIPNTNPGMVVTAYAADRNDQDDSDEPLTYLMKLYEKQP